VDAKILIVDDSAFIRRIVKDSLNGGGFQDVIEAENGEQALRKYAMERPDLVLLDVIMPGLDGTEVLKKIMVMDENAKVIMLSAVGQDKTKDLCSELGAVGYVVKPFDKAQLVKTVTSIISTAEKNTPTTELTKAEQATLREVGHMSAQQAATALSKMVGKAINAKLLAASMTSLADLPEMVGDKETLVSGIHLPVTGDLSGSLLMVFPQPSAFTLVDLLLNKKLGTTRELDEMGKSALNEVGNILAGNCLTALSHKLGMYLIEHVPDFAHGMVGALIDNVAVAFGQKAEQALIIQVELCTEAKIKVIGYFFLLFSSKEANAILKAVKAKAGA